MANKGHDWGKGLVLFLDELQKEGINIDEELNKGISTDFSTVDNWIDFCYGIISSDKNKTYLKHLNVPETKKEIMQKTFEKKILDGSEPEVYIELLPIFAKRGFLDGTNIIQAIYDRLTRVGSHDSIEINSIFRTLYELHKVYSNEVHQLFLTINKSNNLIFPLLGTYIDQEELYEDDKFSLALGIYTIIKYNERFENSPTINKEFSFIREILLSPSKHREILKNYIDILKVFNDNEQLFIKQASSSEEYKIWLQEAFKISSKRPKSRLLSAFLRAQRQISPKQWWTLLSEQNIVINFLLNEIEHGKKLGSSTSLLNGLILHAEHLDNNTQHGWPPNWYKLPLGLSKSEIEQFVDNLYTIIQERIFDAGYAFRIIRVYGKSLIESGFLHKKAEEFVELAATIITRNQGEELQWVKDVLVKLPSFFDNVPRNRIKYLVDISKNVLLSEKLPDFGANESAGTVYWSENRRRDFLKEIIHLLSKSET